MLERPPYTASFAHSPSPALSPEHPDYDKILHRAIRSSDRRRSSYRFSPLGNTLDAGFESADPIGFRHAAAGLKGHMKSFQPSDYDSLIEERNINGKCGYVLCPRPPRSENTEAKLRIIRGKGRGEDAFRVVLRQTLEQWCPKSVRREDFIRVQLSEEPAWMRAEGAGRLCY
jgi:hypothetical protein